MEGRVEGLALGRGLRVQAPGDNWPLTAGVPGERVACRLDGGQVVSAKPLERSSDRVDAPCGLVGRCGGCALQEMAYPAQVAAKRAALVKAMKPLGASDVVGEVYGLPTPFGYRTKLVMPATERGGRPSFGFYARGTTRVLEAEGCPVQHPLTLSTLATVRQVLEGAGVRVAERAKHGWLHGLSIRVDPATGQTELILAGRSTRLAGKRTAERLAGLPGLSSVYLSASEKRSGYLIGDQLKQLSGRRRTVFTLGGESFHLSPGSFFQTSHAGAELLVEAVLRALPKSVGSLADVYGGVGVFTRLTADRWGRAVIVESNDSAVADARAWLKVSGAQGIKVAHRRAEEAIGEILASDVALLDPPRSGCEEALIKALRPESVPTIVYVACGFEALQRDLALLTKQGYRIDRVEAVDMFPHTTHLETVVVLR